MSKLIIGQNGILSTPGIIIMHSIIKAASNLIRKRNATGGILLTASHNPGGPDNDFGIKYNIGNGGPAPENVTLKIYEISKTLKEYSLVPGLSVDLSTIGITKFENFQVEVVDSVSDYVLLMKEIFDFEGLKRFFENRGETFNVLFDAMHGVTGPYATAIFVNELQLKPCSVMNCIPKEDFAGGHPDPNLTVMFLVIDFLVCS